MELAVESDHSNSSKPIGVSSNKGALTREQEIERQWRKVTESTRARWDRLAVITVITTEQKQIDDRVAKVVYSFSLLLSQDAYAIWPRR